MGERSADFGIDWIAVEKAWAKHLKAGRRDELLCGHGRYPRARIADAESVVWWSLGNHWVGRENPRLCSGCRMSYDDCLTPWDGAIEPHEDGADGGGDVEGVEQARDVLPHEALAERPHSG